MCVCVCVEGEGGRDLGREVKFLEGKSGGREIEERLGRGGESIRSQVRANVHLPALVGRPALCVSVCTKTN